ncbi:MAG: hypothetical protein LKG15_10440 [Corynebacterium provencense]|jgi:hypothetical protein|uniref:hypothetical protein n=1 Tax=Corynebacterium provencense TaxID=1737425 RepID=UPI002989A3DA|nr:hypothetical protein [Corynebacterium provencense]
MLTDPVLFGHRDDGSTPEPDPDGFPGGPDSQEAAEMNRLTGKRPTRLGRKMGIFALLLSAGSLVLSGAVTVVLRLGASLPLTPTVIVALLTVAVVIGGIVYGTGGRDQAGRRPFLGAFVLSTVIMGVIVTVGLYVWAVV